MTEPNEEKFFDNQYSVKSIDVKSRTVHAVFSTDAIDSHGERVHQSFKLDRFNSNPVVLWFHNRAGNGLPIGKAHNVAVRSGKLEGNVTFAEHAFAEEVWGLYRDGFLKAFSIGFRPGKVTEEAIGGKDVFVLRDNELFEISAVPIPSNEQSLVKMKSMDLGHICPIWKKDAPAAPANVGHVAIAARLANPLAVVERLAPPLQTNLEKRLELAHFDEARKAAQRGTHPNTLASRIGKITGGAA